MIHAAASLILAAAPALADGPKTFLASLTNPRIGSNEYIEGFSIQTWGVEFQAICRFLSGWRVKAGWGPTADGDFDGNATLGATNIRRDRLNDLSGLALLTLEGTVQRRDIGDVPATFKGHWIVGNDDNERKRRPPLTYVNVRLTPAKRCPDPSGAGVGSPRPPAASSPRP
jgi:hypothetical protein